jgi:hypothetical protein
MDKIEQQISRFKKLDIWKLVGEMLREMSPTIIDMNQQQLLDGLMADGKPTPSHTGSIKSRAYVSSKIAAGIYNNAISPHWNYFNEGDFFDGFKTVLEGDGLLIESSDEKGGDLFVGSAEYNVYGLTDENLDFLIKIMIDTLLKKIRAELGY